ncbi:phosphoglycerate kinase [Candidatus Babeliales bacterium]|nr:phosphoglycerate kinase [Candidatus Babeliales bacterium]
MYISSIKDQIIKGKRVFLRTDLNVPLKDKNILQDYRLKNSLPSIKYIQQKGGKVILATHIGRPKPEVLNKNLSTNILVSWFERHGFKIKFEQDLEKAKIFSQSNFDEILLLENMRFFKGEKGEEKEREEFANLLKNLSDIYVNDAFALIHRNDCSVTLLPKKFETNKRSFGLLVEKEIKALNKLKENIEQPFAIILGGNKIKSKIPVLENFLKQSVNNRPSYIIIGGAIAYTFLKSQDFEVGNSIVENEYINFSKNFLNEAKNKNVNILLPEDHLVVQNIKNIKEINSKNITTNYFKTKDIPTDGICVDIGPKTIENFCNEIKKSKTIFTNGSMGIYTKPEFEKGSKKILEAIAQSNTYSVAGGGDCIAAIHLFNLQDKFKFLSTGGGATLMYLATENPLKEMPAATALVKN